MSKKKWVSLSLVGIGLLLIPRRSSRQTLPATAAKKLTDSQAEQVDDNHPNQQRKSSTTKD